MSHVFRINKGGSSTYKDWNSSPNFPYDSTTRDNIEDPDGGTAKKEITSIPSPFARMELVKSAFKIIVDKDDHDGNSIYHKMVSDTLDVGEIFFNYKKLKDKVEIIRWGREDLQSLYESYSEGHKILADSLDKYLISDANEFNFKNMDDIYLLNYIKGKQPLNIIGATSPATMFFSTANKLDYVADINFGTDKPFDDDYQPLYKRNFEFIKALWLMKITIPDFQLCFPELSAYLNQTYERLGQNERFILGNLTAADLSTFGNITIPGTAHIVNVLGTPILYDISLPPVDQSAFRIRPDKSQPQGAIDPLVLPVEQGSRYASLKYVTDKWGNSNRAPYKDENELNLRTLPNEGSQVPYLTISDFLEDYIIVSRRRPNKDFYFNGNLTINDDRYSVMLPLKDTFFKYFSTDILMKGFDNGSIKMIEIEHNSGGSLSVTLRIPIMGSATIRYVEYNRTYYGEGREAKIDETNNDGGIKELKFNSFIMPHIAFASPADSNYRVGSLYSNGGIEPELQFFNGETLLTDNIKKEIRNTHGEFPHKASIYTIQAQAFTHIGVSVNFGIENIKGVIVPKFRKSQPISAYEFAIDLGTSNTHIEYCTIDGGGNASPSKAFDINDDKQLQGLFKYENTDDANILLKDLLPDVIGTGDFHYPTRTVLTCPTTINWSIVNQPMSMTNLGFIYGKRIQLPYNQDITDIKWGGDVNYITSYIENLMIMLRNKVVLNNGDLARTKISWFYPASMPPIIKGHLTKAYNDAYQKYFTLGSGVTTPISESVAPIRYYLNQYGNTTRMVNIDIGGGTTDISIADQQNVLFTTSFRFASNVLFEDSYAKASRFNGIVDSFKGNIYEMLQNNDTLKELKEIFESIDNSGKPANLASFLFGIKDTSLVKDVNLANIDFTTILQNDEKFKVVFLIFYGAILYQVAQIIKAKGIKEPRHISFSGNGSKIITILTQDIQGRKSILSEFTKAIFEVVLERNYEGDLEILGLDNANNPKEATCKGVLIKENVCNDDQCENIILNGDGKDCVESDYSYEQANDGKDEAIANVKLFFKHLFEDVNKKIRFKDYFGIDAQSLQHAKAVCIDNTDYSTFFDKGLALQKGNEPDTEPVSETTFFYPIKGIINDLSREIKENVK